MILVSVIGLPDMPDMVVSPLIILDIPFCVKSQMVSICARLSYKLIAFSQNG